MDLKLIKAVLVSTTVLVIGTCFLACMAGKMDWYDAMMGVIIFGLPTLLSFFICYLALRFRSAKWKNLHKLTVYSLASVWLINCSVFGTYLAYYFLDSILQWVPLGYVITLVLPIYMYFFGSIALGLFVFAVGVLFWLKPD